MRKLFAFILLCAVFAFASCDKTQSEEKLSEYINSDLKIAFSHPSSWQNSQLDELFVFIQAPEHDGFQASFGVLADKENKELVNKSEKEFFDENKALIQDFKILNYTKTSFAGEQALITTFDSTGEFGKMRQKQYILNHNGKLYILVFTALQKNYKDFEPVFIKIANSFDFAD